MDQALYLTIYYIDTFIYAIIWHLFTCILHNHIMIMQYFLAHAHISVNKRMCQAHVYIYISHTYTHIYISSHVVTCILSMQGVSLRSMNTYDVASSRT